MAATLLEKSIFRTLLFFDVLDYPLTATEVWKWLYRPEIPERERGLVAVANTLRSSEFLGSRISLVEGFYCVRGREHLVPERKRRNVRADHKLKKTERIVRWLRLFPSVRMIALASSVATGNVKEESDIDLVIVTKKNQIWMTRLFVAGFLKLLRKRPDAKTRRDRFCLSFFVTEDALNVERASFGGDDIVFHYYAQSFVPIYDPGRVYPKFLQENRWLSKMLPNAYAENRLINEVTRPFWMLPWHFLFETITWPFFNGYFSDWYCNLQLKIMPDRLKSIANIDSRVIISDSMLKFHDKDNRHELRKKWLERIAFHERS